MDANLIAFTAIGAVIALSFIGAIIHDSVKTKKRKQADRENESV